MKRLRLVCFKETLEKELEEIDNLEFDRINWGIVERLRRLVWCYNEYHPSLYDPCISFELGRACGKVMITWPEIKLPEIRIKKKE